MRLRSISQVRCALQSVLLAVATCHAAAAQHKLGRPGRSIAARARQYHGDEATPATTPSRSCWCPGLTIRSTPNFRDVQRAIDNLYSSSQFDNVDVPAAQFRRQALRSGPILVKERPLLRDWTLNGVVKLPPRDVERVDSASPRDLPIDRAAVAHARYAIDSMYRKANYYAAKVTVAETPTKDGGVTLAFDIVEGTRVTISRVEIEGNSHFKTDDLVKIMDTRPEGFLWFRSGAYDERRVDHDVRDNLPAWYGQHGLIDMQVIKDTLIADEATGKATFRMSLEEGDVYHVGTISMIGNRRFSTEELGALIPFATPEQIGSGRTVGGVFDRVGVGSRHGEGARASTRTAATSIRQ